MAGARGYNLARVTTATTGTGTVTLGSAVSGFISFASAGVADGATVTYGIKDGNNSEIGRGVYTSSGTTLTRATILASTNSNNALNLSGSAEVFLTPAAEDLLGSVNAQVGTTYTVLGSDLGKLVTLTNGSAIAVTLPQATGVFAAGFFFYASARGAGTVTITPTTSTINGSATLTLAQNAWAMIWSDGTNWQAISVPIASATVQGVVELATTAEAEAGTDTVRAVTPAGLLAAVTGVEQIWVPAVAMYGRTTNGAASGTVEMSTNKETFKTLDFDTTTAEYAQFAIRMPKQWNEGTITARFVWSHPSTTTNFGVVWVLQGCAFSNDDAGDAGFGIGQVIADTGGTTNDIYITDATPAITIGGTPAAEDWVVFQIYREITNGSDTMAVDARLHGVTLYVTTDAMTGD